MKKIVIVDDDECVLEVLYQNIMRRGYFVEIADNGVDGYQKIISTLPDIIIMDIKLPDIDGWNILRRLKYEENLLSSKVIVLSASTQKSDRDQAKLHNVSLFVPKPFDLSQLLFNIAKL